MIGLTIDGTDRLVGKFIFLYLFPQFPNFFFPILLNNGQIFLILIEFSKEVGYIIHQVLALVSQYNVNVGFEDHFVCELVLNFHFIDFL